MTWTNIYRFPLYPGLLSVFIVLFVSLLADCYSDNHVFLIQQILLRGIALTCFVTLYSIKVQIPGLIGERGLIPLPTTIASIEKTIKLSKATSLSCSLLSSDSWVRYFLTLIVEKFHISSHADDNSILLSKHLDKLITIDCGFCLFAMLYPHPILFLYLYFVYYAWKRICATFLNFQWDVLLAECLFLSIPLALVNRHYKYLLLILIWSFKLLLFRLMFGSGMVKGYGSDSSWFQDYSAMKYHFQTQPLPTYLGSLIHVYFPSSVFIFFSWVTLISQIPLPLFSLLGIHWINTFTFVIYSIIQLAIYYTGNFGYFNIFTILLSSSLLTDEDILSWIQPYVSSVIYHKCIRLLYVNSYLGQMSTISYANSSWVLLSNICSIGIVIPLLLYINLVQFIAIIKLLQTTQWMDNGLEDRYLITPSQPPQENLQETPQRPLEATRAFNPSILLRIHESLQHLLNNSIKIFYVGSHYGLFANMSKERREVIIEISTQGNEWDVLEFKYKPDMIYLLPKPSTYWLYLPRIDWMFWFLPFRTTINSYPKWFWNFLLSIVEENDDILQLLSPKAHEVIKKHLKLASEHSPRRDPQGHPTKKTDDLCYFDVNPRNLLMIRVRLFRYEYLPSWEKNQSYPEIHSNIVSPTGNNTSANNESSKQYWKITMLQELLPPCNRHQLYRLYDQMLSVEQLKLRSNNIPHVETPQDIIYRTLFQKTENRTENEHLLSNENSASFLNPLESPTSLKSSFSDPSNKDNKIEKKVRIQEPLKFKDDDIMNSITLSTTTLNQVGSCKNKTL